MSQKYYTVVLNSAFFAMTVYFPPNRIKGRVVLLGWDPKTSWRRQGQASLPGKHFSDTGHTCNCPIPQWQAMAHGNPSGPVFLQSQAISSLPASRNETFIRRRICRVNSTEVFEGMVPICARAAQDKELLDGLPQGARKSEYVVCCARRGRKETRIRS